MLEPVTVPETPTFEDFWKLYPRHMARVKALKSWNKLTTEQRFCAVHSLPVHIRYWEASGTSGEFVPYPATWLNQERWSDELQLPEPEKNGRDWMKTTAGIAAKAQEVGIQPRAGEDWHSLKARILGAMKAA
jgi:hypothetical protein